MSQINESLVKNLVSVFAGVALANKLGKKFADSGKPSEKTVKKIIDKDPKLKKAVAKLQKDADELDVIIKSKLDKLPPEDVKRFNKLFGK